MLFLSQSNPASACCARFRPAPRSPPRRCLARQFSEEIRREINWQSPDNHSSLQLQPQSLRSTVKDQLREQRSIFSRKGRGIASCHRQGVGGVLLLATSKELFASFLNCTTPITTWFVHASRQHFASSSPAKVQYFPDVSGKDDELNILMMSRMPEIVSSVKMPEIFRK